MKSCPLTFKKQFPPDSCLAPYTYIYIHVYYLCALYTAADVYANRPSYRVAICCCQWRPLRVTHALIAEQLDPENRRRINLFAFYSSPRLPLQCLSCILINIDGFSINTPLILPTHNCETRLDSTCLDSRAIVALHLSLRTFWFSALAAEEINQS